jgi:hypothetical protein
MIQSSEALNLLIYVYKTKYNNNNNIVCVRYVVLVTMTMMWNVKPRILVDKQQHCGGTAASIFRIERLFCPEK